MKFFLIQFLCSYYMQLLNFSLKILFLVVKKNINNPVDTGRKLNVQKTLRSCPGHLLNVLCTFNLRPVSTGILVIQDHHLIIKHYMCFLNRLNSKEIQNFLISQIKGTTLWRLCYQEKINGNSLDCKNVYLLLRIVEKSKQLCAFQFKLLDNALISIIYKTRNIELQVSKTAAIIKQKYVNKWQPIPITQLQIFQNSTPFRAILFGFLFCCCCC